MKRRIERAIEQRTAMLSGVSHDLRTILTRFKLSLAMIGESAEIEDLKKDVDEMQAHAGGLSRLRARRCRGDRGPDRHAAFLEELRADAERTDGVRVVFQGQPT